MSAKKKQSEKDAHPLAMILRTVHLALWQLPGELHALVTKIVTEEGDEEDGAYTLGEHIESITELLDTTTNLLEELCKEHEGIVLEQIARLLRFVSKFRLKAGWRFVQLADYMRDCRRQNKNNQGFQRIADECGIPDRRELYIHEFANLMSGVACHLEGLFLNMSLPIIVARSSLANPEKVYTNARCSRDDCNPEDVYAIAGRSPEDHALKSFICSIRNAARRLRNYDVSKGGRKEFLVASEVLGLRYELDEARHLLVHCEDLMGPELLGQAQVAVNVLWDYAEDLSNDLITALWMPPGPPDIPTPMDAMVKCVSAGFARANERRILLEELSGRLQSTLLSTSIEKKTKTPNKVGRPKVQEEEAKKRRELKAEWEQYRDTIRGTNKKKSFCDDKGIKVDYLNNSVLRWCREHPE